MWFRRATISMTLAALLLPAAAWADATIEGKVTARKKKYLRNAVVYLEGITTPPPRRPAHMDQVNQQFTPRVLPVVRGQTVVFKNSDNTGHNVYTPDGERYDLGTWPKGQTRSYTFRRLGVYTQLCKLHPQMIAYVVVLPNRYFAVTDENGNFTIRGVPPGTYTLRVWHERRGAEPIQVQVRDGQPTRVEIPLTRRRRR